VELRIRLGSNIELNQQPYAAQLERLREFLVEIEAELPHKSELRRRALEWLVSVDRTIEALA
jgi:hypothetical protein